MAYVPEIPEDRKRHKAYHDEVVNGLRASRVRSDHVIWEQNDERITVVNFQSPVTQKRRAERISSLAHCDTNYDFAPYSSGETLDARNVHLFLGYVADRGISLLLVEKRSHVWEYTWEEYEKHEAQQLCDHVPIWSVGFVWVHRGHRRRGWARRLAKQAARLFAVDIQSFGWRTPFSDDGEAMVRRFCPDRFYIAK
jgi:ribosomal protein S18 acetylase RimI-like enzyme